MELTNKTFNTTIDALEKSYIGWELPSESFQFWKNALALAISDELLPIIITDWIPNITEPPMSPAEIIKYASKIAKVPFGNADAEIGILIRNVRDTFCGTNDFETFVDEYSNSFASATGISAQEAYIKEIIHKQSSSPKILISIYADYKDDLKDCFTHDDERSIGVLQNKLKKSWNQKVEEAVKGFLISGETEFSRNPMLSGNTGKIFRLED